MPQSNWEFAFREQEIENALLFLEPGTRHGASRFLHVFGLSGTGKTTFVKELLNTIRGLASDSLILYLDLLDDEFVSANLFESLICLCWNDYDSSEKDDLLVVPHGRAFRDYIRRKRVTQSGVRHLYRAVKQSAALIPGFRGAVDILPDSISDASSSSESHDFTSLFSDYLSWVASRHNVFLTIDNYQYLNSRTRMLFESRLGRYLRDLRFIAVERTRPESKPIERFLCYPNKRDNVELVAFTRDQTTSFLKSSLGESADVKETLSRDCYLKTGGNPKLAELYLRAHLATQRLGRDRMLPAALTDTIDSLPTLARSVILLTSIFTAGLKRQYVESTLRALAGSQPYRSMAEVLDELVALGYIVINGSANEMVRAAHEQVIRAMADSRTEEEILDLRQHVIRTFDEAIASGISDDEYHYVLHCLIGILHLNEAIVRLDKVAELIDYQHRSAKYEYVVMVHRSNPRVISSLPPLIARHVLDSLQKTCQFALGYAAIQELMRSGFEDRETLELFSAKFHVQTYRPEEALSSLVRVPRSPTSLMIQLNALLCLAMDDEARGVLAQLEKHPLAEELYIGLRNTAHLFNVQEAKANLLRSHSFFRRIGRKFVLATILNNLAVVHLCAQELEDAERALQAASQTMSALGSVEVFESKINTGVLLAAQGEYTGARAALFEAQTHVPRELLMDRIAIQTNIECLNHFEGSAIAASSLSKFEELHERSLQIADPRLHDILAYNCSVLAGPTSRSSLLPRQEFLDILASGLVGTELLVKPTASPDAKQLLMILSPHWRY